VRTRREWRSGIVWSDEEVEGERLLLLKDPADLQGRPIRIRSVGARRSGIARVERSSRGHQGLVHPALARQLGIQDRRFEAEWRAARWYEIVWDGRMAVLVTVLGASAAIVAAALGFHKTRQQIGWAAVVVVVLAFILAIATVRQQLNIIKP
jgi:hypothetical protein